MYCEYWGLEERPFEHSGDARFFYRAASHEAALLKLRYVIQNRRGCALVAGPSGVGKSMLLRLIREQLPESTAPVVPIVFPQMGTEDLLAYLADELTAADEPSDGRDVARSVKRIQRFLDENAGAGRHAVVVIDEAHLLEDGRTWEALRLLLNFETNRESGLTLVFSGHTTLLPTLERMPALEERLAVRCLVRPLDAEETVQYVRFRLQQAGAEREIFREDALEDLYAMTHGIPRQINRLADLALLVGYGEEIRSIGAEALRAVQDELLAVAVE